MNLEKNLERAQSVELSLPICVGLFLLIICSVFPELALGASITLLLAASLAHLARNHKLWQQAIWVNLLICFGHFVLVSYSTGDIFQYDESFGAAFDFLGTHLLRGIAEAEKFSINSEGFLVNGKTYLYFGPFPAFLRILLNGISNNQFFALWCQFSTFCAALLAQASASAILVRALEYNGRLSDEQRVSLLQLALLGLGFGSPLLFLVSCSYIYHEVLAWGLALGLSGLAVFYSVLSGGANSLRKIALLSLIAGCCFLTRVPMSIPLFFAFAVLCFKYLKQHELLRSLPRLGLASLPLLASVTVQLWYNQERFGFPLTFVNYQRYIPLLSNPAYHRELNQQGVFSPQRIPFGIENYFFPGARFFSTQPPYVRQQFAELPRRFYPGEYRETVIPLSLASGWLIWGMFAGLFFVWRGNGGLMLGTIFVGYLAELCLICSFYYVTQRYAAEFVPPLILFLAIYFKQISLSGFKFGWQLPVIGLLVLTSSLITLCATMAWTVEQNWGAPSAYRALLKELIEPRKPS